MAASPRKAGRKSPYFSSCPPLQIRLAALRLSYGSHAVSAAKCRLAPSVDTSAQKMLQMCAVPNLKEHNR